MTEAPRTPVTVLDGTRADLQAYDVSSETPMRASVHPGQPFVLRTLDASGNRIRPGLPYESLDEALASATRVVVEAVGERTGVPRSEAYLIVSVLLRVQVCQVVNPHTSVAVSLASGLDERLVPTIARTGRGRPGRIR